MRICTQYAQKGMWNIFIVVFCFALALPFFNPYFFIGYLIAIAFFGLFQAIFMANAGGAWDNAKKIVEVDCARRAPTCTPPPSSATPWAIRSRTPRRWRMNPVIKFTTLFGLLAVEIAVDLTKERPTLTIGVAVLLPDRADLRLSLVLRHAHRAGVKGEAAETSCRRRRPKRQRRRPPCGPAKCRRPFLGSGILWARAACPSCGSRS